MVFQTQKSSSIARNMASKGPRIWDYLNAVTQTKDRSLLQDEQFDKDYQPFVINKMLSQHRDCVLAANMMNEHHETPKKSQFLFLLNTLRARFRRNEKSVKNTDSDDVGAVAEYYECSIRHARDLVSLHTSDQLANIHSRLDKGGGATKRSRSHEPL
jgi:conjugal transfer/entry exclusion protein